MRINTLKFTLATNHGDCCPPVLTVRRGQTNPMVKPIGKKRLRDVTAGDRITVEAWYDFNGVRIKSECWTAEVMSVERLG